MAAISVLLGRAWQHLCWDVPFRAIFWDEKYFKSIAEYASGQDWEAYITSEQTELFINQLTQGIGVLYLLAALCCGILPKLQRWTTPIVYFAVIQLILLAFLYCKDNFYFSGQFFEYSLQCAAPIFLWYIYKNGMNAKLLLAAKITIALTFISHGLYAMGFYPVPGNFVEMTINCLGMSESNAKIFLYIVGILDIIFSIGLFLPARFQQFALIYMIVWGFLTALARLWGNYYDGYAASMFSQFSHEFIYRIPHFVIPLAIYKLKL